MSSMDDKTIRAMIGDAEAAKRCTEAGVALPCPFCGEIPEMVTTDVIMDTQIKGGYAMFCNTPFCSPYADITGNNLIAGGYRTEKHALAAWNTRAAVPNGWIPCGTRLPELETSVLIMQNYAGTGPYANVTIGRLHQDTDLSREPYWAWIAYGYSMAHGGFICPGSEYVTHWMPLPTMEGF